MAPRPGRANGRRRTVSPSSDLEVPVFSLLLLTALPGQFVNDADFSKKQQQAALEATVRVYHPGTKLYGESKGSGVVVGRKDKFVYVLTAEHNLPPGIEGDTVQLSFYTAKSFPNPSKKVENAKAFRFPEVDLAVIVAELAEPCGILRICPPDRVRSIRNPERDPFPVLTLGVGLNEVPVIEVDRVRHNWAAKPGTQALFFEADREPAEGRSGGPLVDKHGYVIGICNGKRRGKGYYLFVGNIHTALQSPPYRWLYEDPKPPAK
jgi:hypothetical protein